MATAIPKNSVWSAMNYLPPRGRCNHKASLMSPACPCLRFMLHPVKAATSFECDGCNHHASFHSLENPEEDKIIKKWEEVEESNRQERQAIGGANKKRKRIADKPANLMPGVFELVVSSDEEPDPDVLGIRKHVVSESEVVPNRKTRGEKAM